MGNVLGFGDVDGDAHVYSHALRNVRSDGMLDNGKLANITTHQRVETWAGGHPIGYAVNKLHQSILDKTAQNFLFIRYEDLCTNPKPQVDSIYRFFGLEPFEHNYEHIPQITIEDDTVHGIYGDHIIRNTLGMLPDDSKEVLGDYTNRIRSHIHFRFHLLTRSVYL